MCGSKSEQVENAQISDAPLPMKASEKSKGISELAPVIDVKQSLIEDEKKDENDFVFLDWQQWYIF